MHDLDRLFAAWLAGPLSEADAVRLRDLLCQPEQRRRWRALADLEGALAERGAAKAAEPDTASLVTTRRLRSRPSPRPWRGWWLAAAGLMLALGAGWWLQRSPDADLPQRDGQSVARGTIVDGAAELRWPDGTVARIASAGRVQVSPVGRGLELQAGELAVQAAVQAAEHPFHVGTPHALTQVVGTRFSLRCAEAATTLLVEEGTVAFTPAGGPMRTVQAGGRALAGRPIAPSGGLVAWWPLGDGSGTTARDASGQGHDGRIEGPQWTSSGLRFAGDDDHIEVDPVGALATVQEGDYSLAAWFRPEALPSVSDPQDPLEARRDSLSVIVGRTGWTLGLHLRADGSFFMQHFLADRSPRTSQSADRAQLGRWYHLVGVVDRTRGETSLAVDGVLGRPAHWPAAGVAAFNYGAKDHWRIGISTPGGATCRWPARGHIREVRVYGRVLTADEIFRLAAAP